MQFLVDRIKLFLTLSHKGNGQGEIFSPRAESSRAVCGRRVREIFQHDAHDFEFKGFDVLADHFERKAAREFEKRLTCWCHNACILSDGRTVSSVLLNPVC
jgi:hypothetical protein